MKVVLSAFAAAAALTAAAHAQEQRSFDLPAFDRIDVSAGVMLVANLGDKQSVTVEASDGDFSDLEIGVKGGTLTVSREWNRLRWNGNRSNYKIFVTAPRLVSLDASSGSHASVSKIAAARFAVDLSSGAISKLDGDCENCRFDISSGANLDAQTLACNEANIDVSSGGRGVVTVRDSVIGDASSGGVVAVYGNPQRVVIDRSSGGRIKLVSAAQAQND